MYLIYRFLSAKKIFIISIIFFLTGLLEGTAQAQPSTKFQLNISGGYSQLFSTLAEDLPIDQQAHIDALKKGMNAGIRVGYCFMPVLSVHASYNYFATRHKESINITSSEFPLLSLLNTDSASGYISDDAALHFWGVGVDYTLITKSSFKVNAGIEGGYILFTDHNIIQESTGLISNKSKLTGGTFAPKINTVFSYKVTPCLSVELAASALIGKISKLEMKNAEYKFNSSQQRNISRIDLNLGISFWL